MTRGSCLALAVMVSALVSHAPRARAAALGWPDPVDVVYRVELCGEAPGVLRSSALPARASPLTSPEGETPPTSEPRQGSNLHPQVASWLDGAAAGERDRFIVSTSDDRVSCFPLPLWEPLSPEQAAPERTRARELIARRKARRDARDPFVRALAERSGGVVLQHFWLADAALMELTPAGIRRLVDEPSVTYIEPAKTNDLPPGDADPDNDVDDARALLLSDPWFDAAPLAGRFGLLDTGVRHTHEQFNLPARLGVLADCTSGAPGCTLNAPGECQDHGTKTAGILAGNARSGAAYRGLTAVTIDSWKVYGCSVLDADAALRAFQQSVESGNDVIVAEMQASGAREGALDQAANCSFDLGAVVVAANGNVGVRGLPPNVTSPAKAQRVLGIGAYSIHDASASPIDQQSFGPVSGGRIKPDILMPTDTEASSSTADDAHEVHMGTSGAAAYGGAVGMLLRNWLRRYTLTDPGQVYALLILAGQRTWPFDPLVGAGPAVLPSDGVMWWGKALLSNGESLEIPLDVPATATRVDAALWWPDYAVGLAPRNNLDLDLMAPSGFTAESHDPHSVFERARVEGSGALGGGTWKLAIRGVQVLQGTQVVYWAGTAGPGCQ